MIGDIQDAIASVEAAQQQHTTALTFGSNEYPHLSEADRLRISQLLDQTSDRLEEIHSTLDNND